jgi:hypothetical protein
LDKKKNHLASAVRGAYIIRIEALSFLAPLLAAAGVRTVAANRQARRTSTQLRLHIFLSAAGTNLTIRKIQLN